MKNLLIAFKNGLGRIGNFVIKPFSLLTGYFMGRGSSSSGTSAFTIILFCIAGFSIYKVFFAKKRWKI